MGVAAGGVSVGGTVVAVGGGASVIVIAGEDEGSAAVGAATAPLLTGVAVGSALEQAASRVEMMIIVATARKSLDILFPRILLAGKIL